MKDKNLNKFDQSAIVDTFIFNGELIVVLTNKLLGENANKNALLLAKLERFGNDYRIKALTDEEYENAYNEYKKLKGSFGG